MTTKTVAYEGEVQQEWIDYNGHMNDACYVVVFSKAIDAFMLEIGLDEQFREQHKVSIYTLQSMVHYLREVALGEPIRVEVQILEYDKKKLRLFFTMLHGTEGHELAAMETLLLHMDMENHRAAPFLEPTQERVESLADSHGKLGLPELAGASIALRRPAS